MMSSVILYNLSCKINANRCIIGKESSLIKIDDGFTTIVSVTVCSLLLFVTLSSSLDALSNETASTIVTEETPCILAANCIGGTGDGQRTENYVFYYFLNVMMACQLLELTRFGYMRFYRSFFLVKRCCSAALSWQRLLLCVLLIKRLRLSVVALFV